ncbi:MAG: RNA polymerase sigma factor [Bacteroidales bacterium]|jgi:RNA polymerase sigma-70 factor (ECF subfamily)|nr:RNA polymerase sigma factor [Bacteroidales bacterium]
MVITETPLDFGLIERCLKKDRKAQYEFYEKYAPKLYGICLRYAKTVIDAEDILQDGFIKVFRYLGDYRGEGSFEGWLRKIMVTTAMNYYKKKNLVSKDVEPETIRIPVHNDHEIVSAMSHQELLRFIFELPDGYRTVFNLNTIEGYSHKEIGEMMHISVNTSKSQLSRAKSSLRKRIDLLFKQEESMMQFQTATCY